MRFLKLNKRLLLSVLSLALLSACNGGGGEGDPAAPLPAQMPVGAYDPTAGGFPALSQLPSNNQALASCASSVVSGSASLSGSISYERRPMAAWSGLLNTIEFHPSRGVVVEAVAVKEGACSQEVLATTLSDGNGDYAFQLAADVEVCVQVRAQLYRDNSLGGAAWDVQVTDNTRNNAPYYLLDNSPATVADAPIRNLLAGSGWDGVDYTGSRAAAPFAVLDTACEVIDALVDPANGLEKTTDLPALKVRWSVDNTPVEGDLALGEVETAFFRRSLSVNELFLRGDKDVNTDEFDAHVIVHELAHYISLSFLRSDSLGGKHSLSALLDATTAFEEGWANAFAGIVLDGKLSNGNEVLFRDSLGVGGVAAGGFRLDSRESFEAVPGWFSEGSVHRLLYNLYDTDNSTSDRVSLSLPQLYSVMKSHSSSNALTSIFSFFEALRVHSMVSAADRARLLSVEAIDGTGDFANAETNDGGNPDALPVYTPLLEGQVRSLCSNNFAGTVNRLGNYRYLSFSTSSRRNYSFTLQPTAVAGESDGLVAFDIMENGNFVVPSALASGPGESLAVSYDLPRGDYVLALSHNDNIIPEGEAPGRKCFDIRVN